MISDKKDYLRDLGERLRTARKSIGLTQEALAEALGVTKGSLSQFELGLTGMNIERLYSISNLYHINIDWLLTGEGSMFKLSGLKKYESLHNKHFEKDRGNIIRIPEEAAAGFPAGFKDTEYIDKLPRIHLPGYENGTYFMIRIFGDSMENTICNGDYVIAGLVEDPSYIREMHVYVLHCQEGLVCKRVAHAEDRNAFLLRSDNGMYPPYEIYKEEIKNILRVYGVFTNDLRVRSK